MPGFYIQTFGCQMNVADSEQMKSTLTSIGYEEIKTPEQADLILLNTCSVREKPEERVSTFAHQYNQLKNKNPNLMIGITGCVAQQEKDMIVQNLPFVDFVLGPDNIDDIGWALEELQQDPQKKIVRTEFDHEPRVWRTSTKLLNPGPSAFINVMKGCDHFCSYCIVPMTRGREKSRPLQDILTDVRALIQRGVKEFTFLGQNINSYGKRSGESLHELFDRVHEIDRVQRIRFTTSHPGDLTDDLIERFRTLPKLCSQFHLPVQCGSNKVLRSMRRFYSIEQYHEKVAKLKEARPDIALTTDIIVGFPGETDEDFEMTMDLMRKVRYENTYSFMFSSRPGTAAAGRADNTTYTQKLERLTTLQKETRQSSLEVHQSMHGKVHSIMLEGPSKKNLNKWTGRNSQGVPTHIDFTEGMFAGQFIDVLVTEAKFNHLLAVPAIASAQIQHGTQHSEA